MPSREPRSCLSSPWYYKSQPASKWWSRDWWTRKKTIQRGMVGAEVMVTEPQSHIETHIVFLDMLQRGELLRSELLRKARPEELRATLELCLNMKEGNLTMPKRNPRRAIFTTLANRNISLSNKKNWMLEYNKMLYNTISPALKEWKRKFRRI